MPRSVPIHELNPRWLKEHNATLRYGMGISLDCPTHGPPCRLEFWFAEPYDGEAPRENVRLWNRTGGPMDEISITPLGAGSAREDFGDVSVYPRGVYAFRPLDIPGHWRGWILNGQVTTARSPHE